jgi:hypothetical protein
LTVGTTSSFTTSAANAAIALNSANLLIGAVALNTNGATGDASLTNWPAPGSEDTELGVILEPEVVYGTQTLWTRVQA